jgi:hypothetical protein
VPGPLGVAQFGRALHLGCRGRQFEPGHLDKVFEAHVDGHSAFNGGVVGSRPAGDTKAPLAQLVERLFYMQNVIGSIPIGCTILSWVSRSSDGMNHGKWTARF